MSKSFALIMPKSTFLEDANVFGPLGLWYLASRLESLGHKVDYFDLNVDEFPPDVYDEIWVSATSPQRAEVVKIGKRLLSYDARAVIGGAGAWANPESFEGLGYDLVVGGEADSPDGIKKVLETDSGYLSIPVSRTLDWALPPSRRWTGKYHSYLSGLDGAKEPCTTMFISRGCPFTCSFCESGRLGVIWDAAVRYEPLDIVEYQIKECKELGFNALAYYDDILILHKKRTLELMKIHRRYDMIWRCFLRSDIINNQGGYDYLKELKDGGLVEIFVGVESASNEIKDNIHKKTTIEQDTSVLEWCRDLGIRAKCSFILGLPGERMDTMQETRRWILENKPDRVQVGRLIPFRGTPLADHPEEYDLKYETIPSDDWFYMGFNEQQKSFVSTSHLSVDEIDEFWHKLNQELKELGISS